MDGERDNTVFRAGNVVQNVAGGNLPLARFDGRLTAFQQGLALVERGARQGLDRGGNLADGTQLHVLRDDQP